MSKLSLRSESYLRRYRSWLRLFPHAFQSRFGEEMVLVLRDQLEDLERRGHPELARDTYHAALSDIPLNAVREWIATPPRLSAMLERIPAPGWRLGSTALAILSIAVIAGATFSIPAVVGTASVLGLATLIGIIWNQTGRVSLTLLSIGIMAGGIAMAVSATSYLPYLPFLSIQSDLLWQYVLICYLGAVIPAYLFATWLHLHSSYYSPKLLASLSDNELRQLEADNSRKRRFAYRGLIAAAVIVAVPNLVALYDPAHDLSFLNPPEHTVARENNAYYRMEAIPLPASQEYIGPDSDKIYSYLFGNKWDENAVTGLLTQAKTTLAAFSDATALPAYQIPGLETALDNPDQRVQQFGYVDYSRYGQIENLAMLAAKDAFLRHDDETGMTWIRQLFSANSKIDASNQPVGNHNIIDGYQLQTVQLLGQFVESGSEVWKAEVKRLLPANDTVWQNGSRSMRWDALSNIDMIHQARHDFNAPLLPYAFQVNRTAYQEALTAQKLIGQTPAICSNLPSPNMGPDTPWGNYWTQYLTYNGFGKGLMSYTDSLLGRHGNDCEVIGGMDELRGKL